MKFLQTNNTWTAITYNRHSAEDKQENSVPIQKEHHDKFATKFGGKIISHLSDQGVSGLTANRPGFQSLMNDWILNPNAPHFDYILVYDVSRWGRFQNQNEAAYYEHLCEQHGKKVLYTSKPFPKEEQEITDSIIMPMERWMAAQYSRQLSGKVWYGCMKISKDGYSAGGTACYGMTRLLLDENKKPIRELKKGEHKQISNQRVTFAPLNDNTTQTVKDIFDLFVNKWRTTEDISDILNEKGIPSAHGGKWNVGKLNRILGNEVYTGTRLYNKTSGKLKQKKVKNPRDEWVIAPNAFPSIIDNETFWKAQERLFWTIPSRWRRGIMMIRKAQKFVESEIKGLLVKNGFDEDDADQRIKKFPLAYSINSYFGNPDKKTTVFVIEEEKRNYDKIIAVSIALDKKEPIENVFLIPTTEFNQCNFCLFSELDSPYKNYIIQPEKVYENIISFVDLMKKYERK
ncbi:recombinase family protein [Patescibacteria group bacterium]|nr:recombinase family protein [Patescibacteria group bacterium]MDE1946456.1 recombinase family protein [Patescibacteria group bacterium]MDE2011063.1 recombinase family protein [Patescibacteria group bacterium]